MLILHENLEEATLAISTAAEKVYGIKSKIEVKNFDGVFLSLPEFDGFYESNLQLANNLGDLMKKTVMIITPRDIYWNNTSKNDDWAFGYKWGNLMVVSDARMKRFDSQPSQSICIPEELYLKRITAVALHEIGHKVIHAQHYKEATWVNAKTGHIMPLGPHCTDNKCLMYEIVDIRAPPREEGFMQLGEERRYDAGLDDVLERMHSDWMCQRCRGSIKLDDAIK
ncbi:MAG: hypothetical protein AABX07_00220 [Nanoarchaeota archaeon]